MPVFEQSHNQLSTLGGQGQTSDLSKSVCSIPVIRCWPFAFLKTWSACHSRGAATSRA